ncbi:amidohydrolase family protein [Hyphobacterium sp.]|uniref:amidohydrolase family protein n=1 Tax=Hyphobacterium sp. TaxID=2004662 RepID=UPI003BAA299C
MHRLTIIAAVALSACPTACADRDQASPPSGADLAIRNVSVIDVDRGQTLEPQTVWIGEGRILAITGDLADLAAFDGQIIDGGGEFLIPGLWDMHVHALSEPEDAIARILPLFVAHGVTGVRDMGSVVPGLVETRARLADNPALVSPEIVAAGPLLDGQALPWYGDLPLVLETPADVRPALDALAASGVDFFKVYDGLSPAVYAEIMTQAATLDRPVAGHVPRAISVVDVAAAGQQTIEHLTPSAFSVCVSDPQAYFDRSIQTRFSGDYDGYFQNILDWFEEAGVSPECDAAIAALAASETRLTPTLIMEVFDSPGIDIAALAYMPAGGREWCETNLRGIDAADAGLRDEAHAAFLEFAGRLQAAGVALLAGSDTPNFCNVPGPSLHWELERLAASGLGAGDVLRMATREAAAIARRPDYGVVEAGAAASLVLLSANPLEDIRAVGSITHVIHDGRVHDRTALDAMLAEAAAAAETPATP